MNSRSERRWVWMFAALVMTVTLLPYLIGFSRQGADWRFAGFLFGVEDGNSYIAKMLTGSAGAWLFFTPYTAYPQQGVFLFFPYILLGKLAAPPGLHEQLSALFHIYRLAAGTLAILATYDFVALFLAEVRWRRWAVVLATLGGGLGWLSIIGFRDWFAWNLPLEAYSPEAFGFLSIYGLPHMAVARALLLWGLRAFLLLSRPLTNAAGWLRTAAMWIVLWFFQPIIMVVGMFVVAMYVASTGIWQYWQSRQHRQTNWPTWKQYALHGLRILILTLPFAAYTFLSFKIDPILQTWETQSPIISPPPLVYLLGYGVALPLALLGLRLRLRETPWQGIFLGTWLLAAPFLAYAPFSSQRRLIEGVWVILCILAITWVASTGPRLRKPVLGWLMLAFPTTLFLLTAGFMFAANPDKPLFRPADEVRVFEYLALTARPGDVVLAADDSANPMPAWAPVRTLIGHGPESINGPALRERVACFYSAACSDSDRASLLAEFSVAYVIWGPGERELGSWDPETSADLQQVFTAGDYVLYQYKSPSSP